MLMVLLNKYQILVQIFTRKKSITYKRIKQNNYTICSYIRGKMFKSSMKGI